MKKTTIILVALLMGFKIFANPITIPYPSIISEIYFDTNGNWYIEFITTGSYYGVGDFDNLSIVTSTDSSGFKQGIILTDSVTVITQDSLTATLHINKNGDFIKILHNGTILYHDFYIIFGNYPHSWIHSVNDGQSYQAYIDEDDCVNSFFVIQDSTSIGFSTNYEPPTTIFSGHLIDADSLPIPNIQILCFAYTYMYEVDPNLYDCSFPFTFSSNNTDANGYFNTDVFSRKYLLNFREDIIGDDEYYLYDTTIVVDLYLDSINDFIFQLTSDKVYTKVNTIKEQNINIKTYPNPASDKLNILFNLENNKVAKNAVIKLFSVNSDLLKIIPVNTNNIDTEQNISIDVSDLAPGNYYYNLEIDGKKITTEKIIISR